MESETTRHTYPGQLITWHFCRLEKYRTSRSTQCWAKELDFTFTSLALWQISHNKQQAVDSVLKANLQSGTVPWHPHDRTPTNTLQSKLLTAYLRTCMLRRHTALDLGQKSVWERSPHRQTEMGQKNSTNKQTNKSHCAPEEAKVTHNLCGGQQGTERQAEDNKVQILPSYLTLCMVQRMSWHCINPW